MNLSTGGINVMLDALAADLNSGVCQVYGQASGDTSAHGAQPATADTAITTQTLLASNTFGATAFAAASAKQIIANAIASATIAASGTARFVRLVKSDGTTVRAGLTVGAAVSVGFTTLVVDTGGAAKGATSLPVKAISAPVYNGDRFLAGGNKVVVVTADASPGATALVVSALADAIAANETMGYDILMNSAQLTAGIPNSITALTLSLPNGL